MTQPVGYTPATPLPWRVRTIDESAGNIEDSVGAAVAQVQLNEWHNEAGVKGRHALRAQDVAFIVQACNSYTPLLEALEKAERILAQHGYETDYARAAIARATGAA
jgi:hypothetical protein